MEIQSEIKGSKGAFFIEREGKRLAEITFSLAGTDKMIIDHTEVDETLKGQNIGLQLVRVAAQYARDHNMKVMPLCPFAKAVFDKYPEFSDIRF